MKGRMKGVDPVVFYGSVAITVAFSLWGIIATESLGSVMGSVLSWILANFGWGFILIGAGALLLSVYLAVSPRYGRIRLGPDDSRPEFSTVSWIAMMFAAGLGLGLMFYGISEPITHFSAPPHGEAAPRSQDAAEVALRYTYFHWGFNGWALYAVMGLALAYFAFRRGTGTNLVSGTFTPLLARELPAGRRRGQQPAHARPDPRAQRGGRRRGAGGGGGPALPARHRAPARVRGLRA